MSSRVDSADRALDRPLIGMGAQRSISSSGGSSIQGIPEPYLRAVLGAGAEPVIIPLDVSRRAIGRLLNHLDGVLLVGGPDVEPARYGEGQRPECGPTHPERDESEIALIGETLERGLPILGICRGMQVLNVALGGSLYQDLPSDRPHSPIDHRGRERKALVHAVRLEPGSITASVLGGEEVAVNTMHHQAVKDLAPALRAVGWAPDGTLEAVEMPGAEFVIGVQWHPEELVNVVEHAHRLFAAFVAAADHHSDS